MTVRVNKIDLYYEKTGTGPPLILLHGNGESHRLFRKAAPLFAGNYTVYAIDSRGHGKSTRVKPLHYADMAEDAARFIDKLDLEAPCLYGFSDGGIVGLLLAVAHPDMLSKLAVSGANLSPAGLTGGMLRTTRAMYALTRGARWKLMLDEPNIPERLLSHIDIPTLVLAGGRDIVREEHTRAIAGAIPGARLCILPGEDHGSYVENHQKLYGLLAPFFAE